MDSPSVPITSRTKLYEKSAEFARLYYFFEKLTQPRSRGTIQNPESAPRETMADGPVPDDFGPLLKNLSAILTKDEPVDGDALEASEAEVSIPETPMTALASTFAISQSSLPASPTDSVSDPALSTRPRRNTVAVAGSGVDQRSRAQTRFPLREKRYPFTFKLLLHKLYNLDEWAAKVQEVLAASQEQFRSLSSTPASSGSSSTSSGTVNDNGAGATRSYGSPRATFSSSVFDTTPPFTGSPSPPARTHHARSVSKTDVKDIITTASAQTGRAKPRPSQPSRAVKKRIVNRRRSTSGLEVGRLGEWMYDVAVSSIDADNVEARGYESLRRRKRVLSSVGFAEEEKRCVSRRVTRTRRQGIDNSSWID